MRVSTTIVFFLVIFVVAVLLFAFDAPSYDVYLKEADSVFLDKDTGRFVAPLTLKNTSNQSMDCTLKASTEVAYVSEKTGVFEVSLEPGQEQPIKIFFSRQPEQGKIDFNFGLDCPFKLTRHYTKKIELYSPPSIFFEVRFPKEVYEGTSFELGVSVENFGNSLVEFEVKAKEVDSIGLVEFFDVQKLDILRTGETFSASIPGRSFLGMDGVSRVKVTVYSDGSEIESESFDIRVVKH
ncbi:MAG: hypothetical protein J7K00_03525 [Candidatus Diapherotrites archaeon]|nr:hypothetical protein [Candidatus Diapherotrites archaeon]